MKGPWPEERRRELLRLIEKGTTIPQLAHDLKLNPKAVDTYCRRHGLIHRIRKCIGGPKHLQASKIDFKQVTPFEIDELW